MSLLIVRRGLQGNRGATGEASAESVIVANNIAAVNSVATSIANINAVATNINGINTVVTDIADVATVADRIADVSSVASNATNVNSVGSSITNVNTVASNNTNVTTVATNMSAITTVATNITDILAVEGLAQAAEDASTQAIASAASAAASAAQGMYNNVASKNYANSPFVPALAEEGYLFRIDTSGGNFVINLPALAATYNEDMKFAFVKVTNDSNTVTINMTSPDTINGVSSLVFDTQWETHVIIGDKETATWIDCVQSASLANGSVTTAKLADTAVTSDKLGSGSVIEAKLGTDAVTNTKILNGAVTSAKLGDNAVTTAKLDAGAVVEAKIGSGAVTTDKLSTTGVIAGTYTNPTVQVDSKGRIVSASNGTPSGSVIISEQTVTAAANVTLTDVFNSDFKEYEVHLENFIPVSEGNNLLIRVGNGPSIYSTTNYCSAYMQSSVGVGDSNGSAALTSWELIRNISNNASAGGVSAILKVLNPTKTTTYKHWFFRAACAEAYKPTQCKHADGSMVYTATTALTSLQIYFSNGNISSGTVRVIGIK